MEDTGDCAAYQRQADTRNWDIHAVGCHDSVNFTFPVCEIVKNDGEYKHTLIDCKANGKF